MESRKPEPRGLVITVSSGSGRGPTRLAAFDAALAAAGVADFNLVRLSSIIPPASTVQVVPREGQVRGGHGDLLYCVYAAAYASVPGAEGWAGLSWVTRADGAGLLVEHTATSEATLVADLDSSTRDLAARRRGEFRPAGTVTVAARCSDQPTCAVVVAAYRVVSWSDWPGGRAPTEG